MQDRGHVLRTVPLPDHIEVGAVRKTYLKASIVMSQQLPKSCSYVPSLNGRRSNDCFAASALQSCIYTHRCCDAVRWTVVEYPERSPIERVRLHVSIDV